MLKKHKFRLYFSILVLLAAATVSYLYLPVFLGDSIYPLLYREKIVEVSKKYDIYPPFFAALIFSESGFHSNSVSSAGAIGLTQMMPGTARSTAKEAGLELKTINLKDPDTSLELGAAHLSILFRDYSRLSQRDQKKAVLVAYNAGKGVSDRWVEGGMSDKALSYGVRRYIEKILYFEGVYERAYYRELEIENPVAIKKPDANEARRNFWLNTLSQVLKLNI